MDIESLYYFVEAAKDLHFTNTANRLYISQQTLSNHIQRIENYYDSQLFVRKPSLRLTYAGELVLEYAQRMVRENENLKGNLFDVEHHEKGLIRFGASTPRGNICMPEILPAFYDKYPFVEVRFRSSVSRKSEPLVLAGDLDFSIVLDGELDPRLESIPLLTDQIYLCVSDSLLHQYYENTDKLKENAVKKGARVDDFSELPFAIMSNQMGGEIRDQFEMLQLKPRVCMTSTYSEIQLPMCAQGRVACFVSHMILASQKNKLGKAMNIFPLYGDNGPVVQKLVLIHRRDLYLNKYANYFISLLYEYFENLGKLRLVHKV